MKQTIRNMAAATCLFLYSCVPGVSYNRPLLEGYCEEVSKRFFEIASDTTGNYNLSNNSISKNSIVYNINRTDTVMTIFLLCDDCKPVYCDTFYHKK